MQILRRLSIALFGLLVLTASAPGLAEPQAAATPPRLSLIEGEVSFWRQGAAEWSAARQNTPLAPGDTLYAGNNANLELQIGGRAFARAGERTQIGLVNRQRNYLQFRVADGQASFDLRSLPAGLTLEVDTPNAAFTIDRAGYYRLNVDRDTTLFITRRGGRATVIPAGGQARSVAPSEEVVVEGTSAPSVETYVAPEPDPWDRWNYARSDHLLDTISSRYLPSDVYGAEALDQYGNWRVVPNYGPVWVPGGLSAGWAPYSSGHWIWDPFYGWTWIDDAPWGWAPFHYGRWVSINGFWAWAPGPVVQPVYSPALVVFFNSRGGVSTSWVALGWGEPLFPWWGPAGFVGRPWWGGWGGPRVVNNVVLKPGTTVNVTQITFQNTRVNEAVVGVGSEHFGRGHLRAAPVASTALATLTPSTGALPVKPAPASLAAGPTSTVKPTREVLARPAVTLRAPGQHRFPWRSETPRGAEGSETLGKAREAPELRFVPPPRRTPAMQPAPFGMQAGPERTAPAQPPRFSEMRRPAAAPPEEPREREAPKRTLAAPVPAPSPTTAAPSPAPTAVAPAVNREPTVARKAEPRTLRPETAPAVEARERATMRRPEASRPPPLPESAAPAAAARPVAPREARRDDGGPGRRAAQPPESAAKEHRHDEDHGLPGRPANRMSPKHQGMEGAAKN